MKEKIQAKIEEFQQLNPDKRILAVFQTGSHLFKLNTPKSDLDITGIYMPSDMEILKKQFSKEITLHTNKSNTANTSADVDCKFVSFKRYLELLMTGEFNSLELLFAPDYATIQSSEEWDQLVKYRDNFVIFNLSSFIGFVKTEYRKAGFTGNVIEEMKILVDFLQSKPDNDRLRDHFEEFKNFKFIKIQKTFIDNSGKSKAIDTLVIGNRKFQETTSIGYMRKQLLDIIDVNHSSNRKDKDGVDIKGLYHCRRLLYEAESLILSRSLQIPFPKHQHEVLMKIRKGEFSLEELQTMIESEVDKIRTIEDQIDNAKINLPFMEKYLFDLLASAEIQALMKKHTKKQKKNEKLKEIFS